MVDAKENLKAMDAAAAPRAAGSIKNRLLNRMGLPLGLTGSLMLLVSAAAAEVEMTINWTSIANLIEGAAGIMPSIGVLVGATAGVLIVIMVIGFVTGIFGAIIDSIRDITRFFR